MTSCGRAIEFGAASPLLCVAAGQQRAFCCNERTPCHVKFANRGSGIGGRITAAPQKPEKARSGTVNFAEGKVVMIDRGCGRGRR